MYKRISVAAAATVALTFGGLGAACVPPPSANSPTPPGQQQQAPAGGASSVEVFGSGEATVSVMDGSANETSTVQLPHTIELNQGYVSVTVTRSPSIDSYASGTPDNGEVSCRLVRDGEVVDEKTATGEFASATCTKFY